MIHTAIKLYKKYQDKKAHEETGGEADYANANPGAGGQVSYATGKKRPVCPQCNETKKIDFNSRPEEPQVTYANCLTCGTQWRHR